MRRTTPDHILACIMEANPLHRGHASLIQRAREETGATGLIILLSGSFTQRGEAVVVDKYQRAEDLMEHLGADLILSHPLPTATAAGGDFARGAATILHHLNVVDTLVCGSECTDLSVFERAREAEKSGEFSPKLRSFMEEGFSYSVSFRKTLEALAPGTEEIFQSNALLSYGYYKALREENSKTQLLILPRVDGPSASLLRAMSNEPLPHYPPEMLATAPQHPQGLLLQRLYRLQRWMMMEGRDLRALAGYEVGMGERILRVMESSPSYEAFYQRVTTKRYSRGRVARLLLSGLLNITPRDIRDATVMAPLQVLRASARGLTILGRIQRESAHHPIITNGHQIKKLPPRQRELFLLEIKAAKLYSNLTDGGEILDYKNNPVV
ncbi:MAG: nucleotidyltransferase family protein [Tissierellia bacterium]|nr:nucleotidyltransferase family protein [Tissierellia bacterium]